MVNRTSETISVAEAKKRFSEILGRVAFGGRGFIIARRGRPLARLVPLERSRGHLADVEGWLEEDDPFLAEIEAIVERRSRHVPRVSRSGRPRRRP